MSANDLTTLVTDRGPAPMQVAAVLVLDPPTHGVAPGRPEVERLLASRVPTVPRLGQRLVTAPPGCGRPYWVAEPHLDVGRHLEGHVVDGFGGLLELAADVTCRPLPRDRPLWAAHWVTGVGGGRCALVVVAHHVLADGIAGLAVLAALADAPAAAVVPFSTPAGRTTAGPTPAVPTPVSPTRRELAGDAWRARLVAVGQAPRGLHDTVAGLRTLGVGDGPPRRVARTSLNRPTGGRRRIAAVERSLAVLVAAAHRRGCTVNDLVVAATGAALTDELASRGERVTEVVVSVPWSARRSTTVGALGNATGVVPVRVPGAGVEPAQRLEAVRRQGAARRDRPRSASAASAGPLGAVFRGLARLGLFAWFIDRQRLVHTFVTNVRGPAEPLWFSGLRVGKIVPVAVTPGNTGVTVDVLSYAGVLGITVVADPALLPDPAAFAARLGGGLDALTR